MSRWAFSTTEGAMPGDADRRREVLYFAICWLFLFPLGCGIAVLSFIIRQTMSGRHLGTDFNPFTFSISMILFAITGRTTYRFFKKRVDRIERYRQAVAARSIWGLPAGKPAG
jgi:hypothetical protein